MGDLFLFHVSHHADDVERAYLPFIAANAAVVSGQRAAVVCSVDAVEFGTALGADGFSMEGQPPLVELRASLIDSGGEIWLCSACVKKRGLGEEDCIAGAKIVGAAFIVAQVADGAKSITLA